MNINSVINNGSKILKDNFIPNPQLDSEILLAKTINKDRNFILLNSNNFLNENDLNKQRKKLNILDIGVGSGCILLSILKERKAFYGTGIDISKKCLNICKKNADNLEVSSRIKLFKSYVDKFNLGKYDLIVSNPPYIKTSKIKYLERDVAKF